MDKESIKRWLKVRYPITIISDRYDGTYSKGNWLAFPLECDEIPDAVNAGDGESMHFWANYKEPVGRGKTPAGAYGDLIAQMGERHDSFNSALYEAFEFAYCLDREDWVREFAEKLLKAAYEKFKEAEAEHMKDYVDDVRQCAYNKGLFDAKKQMPMPEDTVLFQNGVAEGRRLAEIDMPCWREVPAGETRVAKNGESFFLVRYGTSPMITYRLATFVTEGQSFICLADLEILPKEGIAK